MLNSKTLLTIAILSNSCSALPHPPVSIDSRIKIKDDASSQPTCNRAGLEVVVSHRQEDRAAVSQFKSRAESAEKYSSSVDWWYRYGDAVSVLALTLGFVAGGVVGFEVGRR